VRLHALVGDLETARTAVTGGATVVQLRLKGASTERLVEVGRPVRELCAAAGVTFVVNDDARAARALDADYVHIGRADLAAADGPPAHPFGLSAATVEEALDAERLGAAYVGAGPVWATPTKEDADPPIGLDGLRVVAEAVDLPVVAIGGIDAGNAAHCIAAGASGVAVVRAAVDAAAVRAAIDRALAARLP
jgi:thiamine-phosphate pyrophosphorylase